MCGVSEGEVSMGSGQVGPVVPPGLYRRREVATRLGLSISAVDLLERRGVLEPVRIPDLRCVRYRAGDVEALLAKWSGVGVGGGE
jgi:hypothetical protein